ncbi:DUF3024 domain-containing protein [Polaribacter sp. Z014]|uniref:DUF3024 domain-containing protein n=1 Tax=Polaribacter sp. Z014 TaxID=2927126 RepID=UPI00201FD9B5|nr:DUF3024 domain-containing protein [Polaribacter sp. Z014]MCL7765426.1 DUF3024 domain-containing protein [Polaribacter sp. Z014]
MPTKIIDINEATIKSYVESLRPEDLEIRKQLDIGYLYKANVVCLFEIRPNWQNPEEKQKIEFARIRHYKTKKTWKLYWMRASGKWELYEPFPESTHIGKIIEIIKEDKHGCFYG